MLVIIIAISCACASIAFAIATVIFATYTVTINGDRVAVFHSIKRWMQYHRDCGTKATKYRIIKIDL